MNYADLMSAIANDTGLTKADVDRVLDSMRTSVHSELKGGGDVYLPGLGRFETQDRKARKGRNPKTGAEIDIPAKRVPKFAPANALKKAVAG